MVHHHLVVPGDTLTQIAGRYNSTVKAIRDANERYWLVGGVLRKADPNQIRVGDVLHVPEVVTAPTGPQRGDEPGAYRPTRELVGTLTPLNDLRRVSGNQYIGGGSTEFEDWDIIEGVHFEGAVTRKDNRPRLFRDCWFPQGLRLWDAFYGQWTFEDCQMGAEGVGLAQDGVKGHHYTARRCRVLNTIDGFGVFDTNRHGPVDVVIEASIVGPLHYRNERRPEGSHNDGVQIQGGTGLRVVGNLFILMESDTSEVVPGDPNPDDDRLNGQGVMVNHGVAPVGDVVVDRNWFTGGGLAVNVTDKVASHGQPFGSITVTNNVCGYQIPHMNSGGYDMVFGSPNTEPGHHLFVSGNVKGDGSPAKVGVW